MKSEIASSKSFALEGYCRWKLKTKKAREYFRQIKIINYQILNQYNSNGVFVRSELRLFNKFHHSPVSAHPIRCYYIV
jgi:hypothetical protein